MKSKKWRPAFFSFYNRKGIESYLENQAQMGWMINKMSPYGWTFRRIEPQKIHFSVVYFPMATDYDPEPSEQELILQDFCAHTGWNLAASQGQLQIFYNTEEYPRPLETDAALELETIHEAAKKTYLPSHLILLLLAFSLLFSISGRYRHDPLEFISTNAGITSLINAFMAFLFAAFGLVSYWSWYHRAQRQVDIDGSFLNPKEIMPLWMFLLATSLLTFIVLLVSYAEPAISALGLILAIIPLGVGFTAYFLKERLKKKKVSAKSNRKITLLFSFLASFILIGGATVFFIQNIDRFQTKTVDRTYTYRGHEFEIYKDPIPLKVENLLETDYQDYSYELYNQSESLFMEILRAAQSPKLGDGHILRMDYQIFKIKMPFLYDWARGKLLVAFEKELSLASDHELDLIESLHLVEDPTWGAQEVYQVYLDEDPQMHFLLLYGDRFIKIEFDPNWNLTDHQKAIVGQKLGMIPLEN